MRRGPKDYHQPGGYKAVCDVCGFVFRNHELRLRWDNLRVCSADMEQRHPQDLIKVKADRQAAPWTRPQPNMQFRTMAPTDGNLIGMPERSRDLVNETAGGVLIDERNGEEIVI